MPKFVIMSARQATISRKTSETEVEVTINLDTQPGSGFDQVINVSTGIGFLDHVGPVLLSASHGAHLYM